MARQRTRYKLSAAFVKSAPMGKHNDGDGLWLHRRTTESAKWFFRFTLHGRRREMGLGSLSDVSLQRARELADAARELAKRRIDPIQQKERESRDAARADNTLKKIAEEAFEARKAELRDNGKAGRWFSPLELHVLPDLGEVPVNEIDQRLIRDTLAPIWHDKAVTARKAMNRLGLVLQHAAALGLDVDIQATDKAKALLGKQRHQVSHIEAMPWRDVPTFYASLSEPTTANLAMRLLILTGHRLKPVRFLRLDQIDGNVWTAPAELIKGREGSTDSFRCHLSPEALGVIELAKPLTRDGFLFPSIRKGVMSDATLSRMMERRGLAARPHGFRTSLRLWLEEATTASHEVKESMVQHKTGGNVERAYRRTDYLDQRRPLYDAWGKFVSQFIE
ncbi:MAG: integrase arm-type DNA-binding domain-containing protein [Hyphomonas sp.]